MTKVSEGNFLQGTVTTVLGVGPWEAKHFVTAIYTFMTFAPVECCGS